MLMSMLCGGGCSFLFAAPPPKIGDPVSGFACTDSPALPIIDVGLAALSVVGAIRAQSAWPAIGGIALFGSSAIYGARMVTRCDEALGHHYVMVATSGPPQQGQGVPAASFGTSAPQLHPAVADGTIVGTAEDAGQLAAQDWLRLVDDARYEDSWSHASAYFRGVVTETVWRQTVAGVRAPLGSLFARKLKSRRYLQTLPGAPDGHYVVLQFETAFAKKVSASETVTVMLDQDGTWRVAGYYVL